MVFRLLDLLSDATKDQVPEPGHCGSMSYCGAADRYPDARDMGYPFSRPFTRPIADTFLALNNAGVGTSPSAGPDRRAGRQPVAHRPGDGPLKLGSRRERPNRHGRRTESRSTSGQSPLRDVGWRLQDVR